jgi:hypothetical protein
MSAERPFTMQEFCLLGVKRVLNGVHVVPMGWHEGMWPI